MAWFLNICCGLDSFWTNPYLRSSCPSWASCIRPHQCPLWTPSLQGRWWGRRCTSGPHCPPSQPGSGSSYAGSRYSAGPPGPEWVRLWPPGSRRLGRLPLSSLKGLGHRLDSQTDSGYIHKKICRVFRTVLHPQLLSLTSVFIMLLFSF